MMESSFLNTTPWIFILNVSGYMRIQFYEINPQSIPDSQDEIFRFISGISKGNKDFYKKVDACRAARGGHISMNHQIFLKTNPII